MLSNGFWWILLECSQLFRSLPSASSWETGKVAKPHTHERITCWCSLISLFQPLCEHTSRLHPSLTRVRSSLMLLNFILDLISLRCWLQRFFMWFFLRFEPVSSGKEACTWMAFNEQRLPDALQTHRAQRTALTQINFRTLSRIR